MPILSFFNSNIYSSKMKKYLYKKALLCLIFIFSISRYSNAQTENNSIDATGDIAFTAYLVNVTNGFPGFAFILLDNCPNNQSIGFTDEEWTGSSFLPLGEGEVIWTNTTGATIAKGTVIKIAAPSGTNSWASVTPSVNIGSIAMTGAFSTSNGDQIFAITGNRNAPGTLLAFVGGITTSTLVLQGTPFGSGGNPTSNLVFNGTFATNVTTASGYTASPVCNGTIAQCNTMINTAASWTSLGTFANIAAFFANSPVPNFFIGSVLPIELISFNAQNETNKTLLTWQTASESDNKGFEIESSNDGVRFESIGFVAGRGTTTQRQSYTFTDKTPYPKGSFYRLKQIDYDGTYEYSKIIFIKNDKQKNDIAVYPNPTNDVLNIITENYEQSFVLFNNIGQMVLQGDVLNKALDMRDLGKGVYHLKVGEQVVKVVRN